MAGIELTVVTETSDGADNIMFIIGGTVAKPLFGKTRTVSVPRSGEVDYDYVINGAPGGKASYEVRQGDDVILAKKERTIQPGKRRFNGGGTLTVK